MDAAVQQAEGIQGEAGGKSAGDGCTGADIEADDKPDREGRLQSVGDSGTQDRKSMWCQSGGYLPI